MRLCRLLLRQHRRSGGRLESLGGRQRRGSHAQPHPTSDVDDREQRVRLDIECLTPGEDVTHRAVLRALGQRLLHEQPHGARVPTHLLEDLGDRGQPRVTMNGPAVHQQGGHDGALVLLGRYQPLLRGRAPRRVRPGERGSIRGGAVVVGGQAGRREQPVDRPEHHPVTVDLASPIPSSNATAESMSELGVASRRPLLPNDSQVKRHRESGCCCEDQRIAAGRWCRRSRSRRL